MNLKLDVEILGWLLVGLGALECVPVLFALGYGEPSLPYVASAVAALIYGVPIGGCVRGMDFRGERGLDPRLGFRGSTLLPL